MDTIKIIISWPYLLACAWKAKRIAKKIEQSPDQVTEEKRYIWLQKMSKYAMWLYDVKLHVSGINNWPKHRGCVIISNHQSNFDPLIFLNINDFKKFAPVAYIAKKELEKKIVVKHIVKLIDVLLLDRKNPRQALEVYDEAKELIKVPRSFVIFPEGTRNQKNQEVKDFLPGSIRLPIKAFVPIVPVAIVNSQIILNKKNRNHKKHVYVQILPPIQPSQLIKAKTNILAKNIQKSLQNAINKKNSEIITTSNKK